MKVCALILASGASSRMVNSAPEENAIKTSSKVFIDICGKSVLYYTLKAFEDCSMIDEIIVVARSADIDRVYSICDELSTNKVKQVTKGGETRFLSMVEGMRLLSADITYVAIHDAARPLVTPALIEQCIGDAVVHGASIAGVKVVDTIKEVNSFNEVEKTLVRDNLVAIQTPQVFERELLVSAIKENTNVNITDDSALIENIGKSVYISNGLYENIKLTTFSDVKLIEGVIKSRLHINSSDEIAHTQSKAKNHKSNKIRIGHGIDVHAFALNRKLILGGVTIPYEKGLLGHSDADCLTHAITDAILGAASLGDIGLHFPDNSDEYKDANSLDLLSLAYEKVLDKGLEVVNIDATIVTEAPKMRSFIDKMRENIANTLKVDIDLINIKATTEEKLGFTGQGEGIRCEAVALLSS